MSVAYEINKSMSRDSRFKKQEDILFMGIKLAGVSADFILNSGRMISGTVRTRYTDFLVVTDGHKDFYIRFDAIGAISLNADYGSGLEEQEEDDGE